MRDPNRCPKCNGWGHWRTGFHFDHEKRCPECEICWCPEDVFRAEGQQPDETTITKADLRGLFEKHRHELFEEHVSLIDNYFADERYLNFAGVAYHTEGLAEAILNLLKFREKKNGIYIGTE